MALENPESLSDPFALSDSEGSVPDSSPLRVSTNTQFESGVPPARQREDARENADAPAQFDLALMLDSGIERMETALANQVRTEANLGALARGLKHLLTSAQAARLANNELMTELDELRTHLTRSQEEEHAMRFRMSQLEQLLDMIRHETTRERTFLIEQQDLFLIEIMTDHERQIDELHDRLREANKHKVDAEKIRELIAQRDQAREYATRCERERDLAWQELVEAAAPTPVKGEHRKRSPSGAAAIGSISLRTVAVPAETAAPDTERSSERPATATPCRVKTSASSAPKGD